MIVDHDYDAHSGPADKALWNSLKPADRPGALRTWADIRQFVFAGNATFTLESKSGVRFTYKVSTSKDGGAFFVGLLRGPDNNSDYAYMGMVKPGEPFTFTRASRVTRDALSAKGAVWFFDALLLEKESALPQFTFWHEGRCGRCGRRLTVPSSIASGIGPECAGRME
jgi:hypothetical protein